MTTHRHLAALGSSFAAGPGVPPIIDRAAMRSGNNYPHLLARLLEARLTDLTVSGATTANLLDHPQRTLLGRRFPAQAPLVPTDADLVTVTAGGNDLGYSGAMLRLAATGWLRSRPLLRSVRLPSPASPAASGPDVDSATSGLARVVEAVRARAPRARVVLVDYLTVVGPDTRPGPDAPWRPTDVAAFRRLGEQLAEVFSGAAARTGADLVAVSRLSLDHGLGSMEPWVTGFSPLLRPLPFHPNLAGMQAVAAATHRQLTAPERPPTPGARGPGPG